ncbi:MAG: hypothetical protein AVDCRST_MAG04-2508, partial [uncultured Acetobacteraceae bacterium]
GHLRRVGRLRLVRPGAVGLRVRQRGRRRGSGAARRRSDGQAGRRRDPRLARRPLPATVGERVEHRLDPHGVRRDPL